jgi:hypothetical protein
MPLPINNNININANRQPGIMFNSGHKPMGMANSLPLSFSNFENNSLYGRQVYITQNSSILDNR